MSGQNDKKEDGAWLVGAACLAGIFLICAVTFIVKVAAEIVDWL